MLAQAGQFVTVPAVPLDKVSCCADSRVLGTQDARGAGGRHSRHPVSRRPSH